MELYQKKIEIYTNSIYLIPTIKIVLKEYCFLGKTRGIEFHFLCFRGRLLWLEEDD